MKDFAVIFDMDGVLVDNNKYHNIAWIEFCKRENFKVTTEDITSRFGNLNDEYFRFLYGRQLDKKESDRLGEEKEAIYREIYAKEIEPAEGLIALLNELKTRGFKLGVATSANRNNLDFVVDNIKIRQFFHAMADSSMVTYGKPNPEVFLKAASLLDIAPSHCLVFEDSVHGVEAAVNAGMKVVALTTTFPPEKLKAADLIIQKFPDIDTAMILKILTT